MQEIKIHIVGQTIGAMPCGWSRGNKQEREGKGRNSVLGIKPNILNKDKNDNINKNRM